MAMACGVCWGAVYVDVETAAGTFTIEMDAGARNGGAAFLGLAEGWVDWVDPQTGEPRQGERYYEGTAMSWVLKDEAGNASAVGNLGRPLTDAEGNKNWNNGAGVELFDDVDAGGALTARSVVMVQQDGPHSIDGGFAVLLKDAAAIYTGRWSRVGTVVSNWSVVTALAGRPIDANGWMEAPVATTGMRVHGDAGEIAGWRAEAETNGLFPEVSWAAAHSTESGIRWMIPAQSRFTMETTEDLLGTWKTDTFWNEREACDAGWQELGMPGRTWFLKEDFLTLAYSEFTGPRVAGQYAFRVEWEKGGAGENEIYEYDLDVGAGTGMVWRLDLETQTEFLESAALELVMLGRIGAHSTGVALFVPDWWHLPYYWLGGTSSDAESGRFRMWDAISEREVWGRWKGQTLP